MGWLERKLSKKMINRLVRHLLTVVVGVLVASETPGVSELGEVVKQNFDTIETSLAALILFVVTIFLSSKDDEKLIKKVKEGKE